MLVWIFQTGELLHIDGKSIRPMRAINLANSLIQQGHEVVLWSSGFFHQEKRHRTRIFSTLVVNDRLTINLIPSPGYTKNIGFKRLFDHAILAINLYRILNKKICPVPDVAFVGYPPIETAFVLLRWLRSRSVPTMLDVKDQWPTLFIEAFPPYLKSLAKLIFFPYYYIARKTFRDASAFCSMSPSYLAWIANFSGRPLHSRDIVVPLTAPKFSSSEVSLALAKEWWNNRGVSTDTNCRFCFVGSFMSVFDFSSIRCAAERFQMEGVNCQFVICGDGGHAGELHSLFSGLNNVIFPGWIDEPKKLALYQCSAGVLIPYKNIDNFTLNLPNKVIDALAYGVPILSGLTGELQNLMETHRVGIFCEGSSGHDYYQAMLLLLDNESFRKKLSDRALALYADRFSYGTVYGNLVSHLENMAFS